MASVRQRRARKKARINSTRHSKKSRRRQTKKIVIPMTNVRRFWDKTKSARANMEHLGLVYNPNKTIRRPQQVPEVDGEITTQEDTISMDTGETSQTTVRTPQARHLSEEAKQLLKELTKKAAMPTLKRCHIAATEAEYLAKLMQKHGGDCKLMVKDKLNYQQMTEAQLRKRCCVLLNSREPRHIRILEQTGLLQTHA